MFLASNVAMSSLTPRLAKKLQKRGVKGEDHIRVDYHLGTEKMRAKQKKRWAWEFEVTCHGKKAVKEVHIRENPKKLH